MIFCLVESCEKRRYQLTHCLHTIEVLPPQIWQRRLSSRLVPCQKNISQLERCTMHIYSNISPFPWEWCLRRLNADVWARCRRKCWCCQHSIKYRRKQLNIPRQSPFILNRGMDQWLAQLEVATSGSSSVQIMDLESHLWWHLLPRRCWTQCWNRYCCYDRLEREQACWCQLCHCSHMHWEGCTLAFVTQKTTTNAFLLLGGVFPARMEVITTDANTYEQISFSRFLSPQQIHGSLYCIEERREWRWMSLRNCFRTFSEIWVGQFRPLLNGQCNFTTLVF